MQQIKNIVLTPRVLFSAALLALLNFITYRNYDFIHGFDDIMGGHAHDEVMDVKITASDVIVLIMLVIILFLAGIYLLKRLKRQCIECIQKKIQEELDAVAAQKQTVKLEVYEVNSLVKNI